MFFSWNSNLSAEGGFQYVKIYVFEVVDSENRHKNMLEMTYRREMEESVAKMCEIGV